MKNLAATYSPTLLCAVPSASKSLTSEFGMGSGVTPPLKPPGSATLFSNNTVRTPLTCESIAYTKKLKTQNIRQIKQKTSCRKSEDLKHEKTSNRN